MSEGEFLKLMGAKIKKFRKDRKLSLPELSRRTGIDMSNLWFVENGQRNTHILTLKRIADVFEIDIKELF